MELHHLRYFVAVAENLSFTKAAAKLHLTQPSLTRQVHNLQEAIGVRGAPPEPLHQPGDLDLGRAVFPG
jgi:Bacterial regulatory helix-turn-helix protein, lysR family